MDDKPQVPASHEVTDPEIARNAVARLRDELPYSSGYITVTIERGWLTLEGEREWRYQRDRAEKAVRAVPGVIGVLDNLRRKPRVSAAEIQRHVEEALKRGVDHDANRSAAEVAGPKTAPNSLRSWAEPHGLSVHREPVGR